MAFQAVDPAQESGKNRDNTDSGRRATMATIRDEFDQEYAVTAL
jgi:hypothetical protein